MSYLMCVCEYMYVCHMDVYTQVCVTCLDGYGTCIGELVCVGYMYVGMCLYSGIYA